MTITWKKACIVVSIILAIETGFGIYSYASVKSRNNDLSTKLAKMIEDNKADKDLLEAAKENAQIIHNELDSMGVLSIGLSERLDNITVSFSEIENQVKETESSVGSATGNIDKSLEVDQNINDNLSTIDDILNKYK